MAIKKMKWQELLTKILPSRVNSKIADLETLITNVNAQQVVLVGYSNLLAIWNEVKIMLGKDEHIEPAWKDLIIFVSSYKENDCRFMQLLIQKLYEYAGFYSKILSDNGIQRHLVYEKEYSNEGSASSVERGTDSVTPQNSALYDSAHPESDSLFDQAIADYASSIDKNKASSNSESSGDSSTTVSGTTWEEGKKNLQLVFYNELCDYLMSIPERIYAYYSIDTVPVPELYKMFYKHVHEVMEMFTTDE